MIVGGKFSLIVLYLPPLFLVIPYAFESGLSLAFGASDCSNSKNNFPPETKNFLCMDIFFHRLKTTGFSYFEINFVQSDIKVVYHKNTLYIIIISFVYIKTMSFYLFSNFWLSSSYNLPESCVHHHATRYLHRIFKTGMAL